MISANIELPLLLSLCMSLLSLSLLPPQGKKKKKVHFQLWIHVSLAAWWELVIEIFIQSERANWQIPVHLCRARAEPARHGAGGGQPQLSPGSPEFQQSWGPWDSSIPGHKKKEAVVQQRGNGKRFTLKDFMLCSRKLAKILICFWEKISRCCHDSNIFDCLN